MITKLLHEHEGELHKEEIDYITNFTFTESYFYGLPKVRHKLSLTCLFVSSELLFNVLIDSSKYLSFVGLGICF
jgi:hypothetical protein